MASSETNTFVCVELVQVVKGSTIVFCGMNFLACLLQGRQTKWVSLIGVGNAMAMLEGSRHAEVAEWSAGIVLLVCLNLRAASP